MPVFRWWGSRGGEVNRRPFKGARSTQGFYVSNTWLVEGNRPPIGKLQSGNQSGFANRHQSVPTSIGRAAAPAPMLSRGCTYDPESNQATPRKRSITQPGDHNNCKLKNSAKVVQPGGEANRATGPQRHMGKAHIQPGAGHNVRTNDSTGYNKQ